MEWVDAGLSSAGMTTAGFALMEMRFFVSYYSYSLKALTVTRAPFVVEM